MATKAGRHYKIGESLFPSVTTILNIVNKPALPPWAAREERKLVIAAAANLYEDIHGTPKMSRPAYISTLESRIGKEKAWKKESDKAIEIGDQTHKIIEWNLRKAMGQTVGPEPRIKDKALWAFMSFGDAYKALEIKPLWIEQVVFSEKYGYAGTVDLIAEVSGHTTKATAAIDFKTGKAIYAESFLQIAAYREAIREMGHAQPELGIILRLPKKETDPEFEYVVVDNLDAHFQAFLHALELWKWKNKGEK
jgi:hypothetical protein